MKMERMIIDLLKKIPEDRWSYTYNHHISDTLTTTLEDGTNVEMIVFKGWPFLEGVNVFLSRVMPEGEKERERDTARGMGMPDSFYAERRGFQLGVWDILLWASTLWKMVRRNDRRKQALVNEEALRRIMGGS